MLRNNNSIKYSPIYAEDIVLRNFPKGCRRVLDFGCGDGHFTRKLFSKAEKIFGCDIDSNKISINKKASKNIIFRVIKLDGKTHFPDKFFDCITLMGVLEHVKSEKSTIKELNRILSPGGVLFIYVHNKGLLGFLDTANIKFLFPTIHRFLWFIFFGKESYKKEFVEKGNFGMFGDFTKGKKRHTHYSIGDLKRYTSRNFIVEKKWYHSMFFPILRIIDFFYVTIFKKTSKFISLLLRFDDKLNFGPLSYNLVVQCKKRKN